MMLSVMTIRNSLKNNFTINNGNFLKSASKDQKEEKEKEYEDNDGEENRSRYRLRRQVRRQIHETLLIEYCHAKQIPYDVVLKDMTFSNSFDSIDPIMNKDLVVDGYVNYEASEIFLDVELNNGLYSYWNLYYLLTKVHTYKEGNHNAKVVCLVPIFESDNEFFRKNIAAIERIKKLFVPAITNGLLELETIEIADEKFSSIKTESEKTIHNS